LDAIMNECQPHDGALRKSAHLIVQASLQPARLATTKRPRNGRVSIADGPFVATEEQAGGFFIIETGDLREAILVASKHSAAYLGEGLGWGLEVRPIKAFKQP
jgi:hypothetical protein